MSYETYVFPSPPEGYGWRVLKDGKVIRSGIASTEANAALTAEMIVEELEAADQK